MIDSFIGLGLSGDIQNRYLNGLLGAVFILYGLAIWTKYETKANGVLGIILAGLCFYDFFRIPWDGHPFKFVHLIGGICILVIGIIYLLRNPEKKNS